MIRLTSTTPALRATPPRLRRGILISMIAIPIIAAGQARTPDGHPDLQGTYDLATLTPLERPAGAKAVLTAEEAAKLEKEVEARKEAAGRAISGDRTAPPKGGDGSTGPAGGVGGYNNFWLDPGSSFTDDPQVDGRFHRPMGRRHARRRHDELHRQNALPRRNSKSSRRREIHSRCAECLAVSIHGRGSGYLDEAVDG